MLAVLLIFHGCILMSNFVSLFIYFQSHWCWHHDCPIYLLNQLTNLNLAIKYTRRWFTELRELFLSTLVSNGFLIHSFYAIASSSLNEQRLFYVITTYYLYQCLLDFYSITQNCVNQVSSYFTSCSVVRYLGVLSYCRSGGTCEMELSATQMH